MNKVQEEIMNREAGISADEAVNILRNSGLTESDQNGVAKVYINIIDNIIDGDLDKRQISTLGDMTRTFFKGYRKWRRQHEANGSVTGK